MNVGVPVRNRWVECFRIVSAFGIVWYHAGLTRGHQLGYAGLVYFLVLVAYYEMKRRVAGPRGLRRLAERLLIPWLFWFAVSAIVKIVKRQPVLPYLDLPSLLVGPSLHLWYLPFAFFCLVITRLTKPWIAVPSLLALGLLLITASTWRGLSVNLEAPFPQYVHALPPVLVGIVLADPARERRLIAAAVMILMLWSIDLPGVGYPYLIGSIAALGAIEFGDRHVQPPPWIDRVAPLMFGVYLIHPLFLTVVHRLALPAIVGVILAFVLSVGATAVLRRSTFGRRVT